MRNAIIHYTHNGKAGSFQFRYFICIEEPRSGEGSLLRLHGVDSPLRIDETHDEIMERIVDIMAGKGESKFLERLEA